MFAKPFVIPCVPIVLERKLRASIKTAKLICPGYEDTVECKLAWERVDEIQKGIRKIKERSEKDTNLQCEVDPLACRQYDV